MKTNNKGFCVFYDWVDDLDHLDGESAWKIVKAICEYHRHGVNPVEALDGPLRTVAAIMFHQIKRGEKISEARRASGQQGGFATAKVHQKSATETETETINNNQSLFLSGASAHTHERETAEGGEERTEPLCEGEQLTDEAPEADKDEDEDPDGDEDLLSPEIHEKLNEILRNEIKQKYIGGKLGQGVVMMNDMQFSALCEELSLEELEKYMGVIVSCETQGKHYRHKTHYQAILDMAAEDRRVQERKSHYGR